ncbi:DUF4838 domain-containing protein [Leadbettera azotonutricia]|uniref:DUF4838 domain-containing protein n=1 Tax=Leadbettera azotonutricia (strain ATCC BAA-888 / DSM 13862 / ZAS-9) TaxID=545695 RepID=F5YDC3_LEAAZ|nr:DUF4838 domain-containing protein [Leadbettera azotonutricia]AEF80756.1 hypothetical protein TREAZ_1632 [Leadbettera azotonutricia ZAS-9]
MAGFDVSKEWAILVPPNSAAAKKGAEDISRCIALLRKDKGQDAPALLDASGDAPPESVPVIVLNSENAGPERNGFTWRAGAARVEIFGESPRGLCKGVYDFLLSLGISWPEPGKEVLPSPAENDIYPFKTNGAYQPSKFEGEDLKKAPWHRFVVKTKKTSLKSSKKREAFVAWAARNKYDALVFPLECLDKAPKLADDYALLIEGGGRELSLLLPRKLFLFHKELFRMEEGKRQKRINFCPTNHETIKIIRTEAEKYFRLSKNVKVFHLWPDKGGEKSWCSCPSCRAFTPAEQNRIAVNAAADALAVVNSNAFISFYESPEEGGDIPLRQNLFKLEELPAE